MLIRCPNPTLFWSKAAPLTWQRLPEKPGGHRHWKPLTSSWQRPPLRHGALAHSSTSFSQCWPSKPGGQTHL